MTEYPTHSIIVLPSGETILVKSELTIEEKKDISDMVISGIKDLDIEISHYLLQRNHIIQSHNLIIAGEK